jgi:GntR family transcriptional regulator
MHSSILISQTDTRPLYVQIVEQIKQRVMIGEWAAGQEIPSIRQLAAELCVSVITVKRAYLELEREGIIFTQHGKGSIVAPDAALSPRLGEKELAQHLEKAVQLGQLLKLSSEDLVTRLEEASERLVDDQAHKETQ